MTKLLTTDECLDVLAKIAPDYAMRAARLHETFTTMLAARIASTLNVVCGEAHQEGVDFAGCCVPFYAAFEGQTCPAELENYDPTEALEFKP